MGIGTGSFMLGAFSSALIAGFVTGTLMNAYGLFPWFYREFSAECLIGPCGLDFSAAAMALFPVLLLAPLLGAIGALAATPLTGLLAALAGAIYCRYLRTTGPKVRMWVTGAVTGGLGPALAPEWVREFFLLFRSRPSYCSELLAGS